MDKDTPFVRQNTPHPKELKLKAHKLFAKEKNKVDDSANLDTLSEEVKAFHFHFKLSADTHSNNKTFYPFSSHHRNHRLQKPLSIQQQWIIYLRHEPKWSQLQRHTIQQQII